MIQIPEIFLDTSALFSGIWSSTGESRMLLKLGEARAVNLFASSQVLIEIENVLRRKAPQSLGILALLLDRSQIVVVSSIPEMYVTTCRSIVNYDPDAVVLAAAWASGVDYFVTIDRKHFLDIQKVRKTVPFAVGTPGDCLAWFREKL